MVIEIQGYKLKLDKVTEDNIIGVFNEDYGPVVVYVSEFRGDWLLHTRKFWKPDDADYFVPTKKGTAIPVQEAEEYAQAIFTWTQLMREKANAKAQGG